MPTSVQGPADESQQQLYYPPVAGIGVPVPSGQIFLNTLDDSHLHKAGHTSAHLLGAILLSEGQTNLQKLSPRQADSP